jgi:hypothetical protein
MATELWSLIAITSFWGWVVTSLLFIFKAFPAFGVFCSRAAWIWGSASVITAFLWIAALKNG